VQINYKWLDAARGLSAFAVFVPHTLVYLWGGPVYFITGPLATYAVMVFFALSGFFIAQSIKSNITHNGRFNFVAYLIARVARIYPPLLGSIVLLILLQGGLMMLGRTALPYADRPEFVLSLAEIGNTLLMRDYIALNGPLWSLIIEFKLYILAMAVAMVFFGFSLAARLLGALIVWLSYDVVLGSGPYAAIWLFAAAVGLCPISNSRVRSGRLLSAFARSADFSYTLYIVHFPLLLAVIAVTKGAQLRTGPLLLLTLGLALAVPLFAAIFAGYLERKDLFASWLLTLLDRGNAFHKTIRLAVFCRLPASALQRARSERVHLALVISSWRKLIALQPRSSMP